MNADRALSLRIAFIGGGSRQWARKLMADLALCPDLGGVVSLHDIDAQAAELNARVGNFVSSSRGSLSRWRYEAEPDLGRCLEGADFVVVSVQPGSLELMGKELEAAARRGRFFPVGDTTGAPGLARGLRTASLFAGFARAIARACPEAWVINYTNPMAIALRAMLEAEPRLKVLGCCHEVLHVRERLAALADVARDSVSVNVLGLNHFTWIDQASFGGRDLLPLLRGEAERGGLLEPFEPSEVEGWNDPFRSGDRVKFSLLKEYGVLAAAGDRHLVEFLPGFCSSRERLLEWGVSLTPASLRIALRDAYPPSARALLEGKTPLSLEPSGEEGVRILRGLLGLGDFVTSANMRNEGQAANLPCGCVVETNVHFSAAGARPLAAGSLPAPVLSLVAPHAASQELVARAALSRDWESAFPAFHNDPATALPLDEARSLFDELLELGADQLPGRGA